MSRYVVCVGALDMVTRYLMLGRLTERLECATKYPHPSNAKQAEANFRKHHPAYICVACLIDTRTGNRMPIVDVPDSTANKA